MQCHIHVVLEVGELPTGLASESEPGTAVASHSAPARADAQGLGSSSTLRHTDNDTVDYVAGTSGAMDVSAPVTYRADVGVAATAADDEVDDGASSAAGESASCASGRPRVIREAFDWARWRFCAIAFFRCA